MPTKEPLIEIRISAAEGNNGPPVRSSSCGSREPATKTKSNSFHPKSGKPPDHQGEKAASLTDDRHRKFLMLIYLSRVGDTGLEPVTPSLSS